MDTICRVRGISLGILLAAIAAGCAKGPAAAPRLSKSELIKQVGLCENWLVIGPFSNNNHVMDRTVYGPEKDFLAGKINLKKVYPVTRDDGKTGSAAWIARPTATFSDTWDSRDAGGGNSGGVEVWVNRKEVLAVAGGPGFSIIDQYVVPVDLEAGANEVFVTFAVTTGFCGNFLRISDESSPWST